MAPAGGGGAELQEAIARRAGALNQQGPGAAGGGGALPSSAPSGAPQVMPGGSNIANTPEVSKPFNAQEMILKAMAEKLKSHSKIEEHVAGIPEKMPSVAGM